MRERNCPKGCGECCKVVLLTSPNPKKWRKKPVDHSWLLKLKRIRKKDAIKIRPILKKVGWKGLKYYKCPYFNYKTNSCTNYENRPYTCSAFPFYEDIVIDASRFKALPNCYFKHQIMKGE